MFTVEYDDDDDVKHGYFALNKDKEKQIKTNLI